jgi:transcriptional regulator with XRE-family HTH domain
VQLPRLKEWRERRGLTQKELGERTGMAQEAISRIETGTFGCRPNTARRLARGLDIPVGELVAPPEVPGDPKELAPRLLRRLLEREGTSTAWMLGDIEEVLGEGERIGTDATRESLIPDLRAEQQALRWIAADPTQTAEVHKLAEQRAEDVLYAMGQLLLEARRREKSPEAKKLLAQDARDLWADAG